MADFDSAPVIRDDQTVLLYGKVYRISGPVQVNLSTLLPPKTVQGDYGKDDNPTISTYTVSDLRGGIGLWAYEDYQNQTDFNRYWTGQNVDPLTKRWITLGPATTDMDLPSGASGRVVTAINRLNDTDGPVFVWDDRVYNYTTTGGWSGERINLGGPSNAYGMSSVRFQNNVYYALGSYGYSYQTGTSAATNVPYAAGPPIDPAVMSFVVWDSKLWAMDTGGRLHSSSTGAAGSWTAKAKLEAEALDFLNLVVYVDSNGDPTIWCVTPTGPYIYDASADKWLQAQVQFPRIRQDTSAYNPMSCAVFQGSLYVQAGDRKVYRLTMAGQALAVEDVSIDRPDGVPVKWLGSIKGMTATNEYLFALLGDSINSTQKHWVLLAFNGRGWHPIYVSTVTSPNNSHGMVGVVNDGQNGYRLYLTYRKNSTQTAMRHLDLVAWGESPITSTNRQYAASGVYELPWFDGNTPWQQKLAIQARIKMQSADASNTLALAYGVDGGTSYTNVGGQVNTTTEVVKRLGTNNVGVAFKSWRWKWTLTGSGGGSAPKIDYVSLDFLRIPDTWRGFVIEVDATDISPDGRNPRQQIEDLWTAIATSTLGTFSYRDDSGNTRSYLVKITVPQGQEATGLNEQGKYVLALTSYGGNS